MHDIDRGFGHKFTIQDSPLAPAGARNLRALIEPLASGSNPASSISKNPKAKAWDFLIVHDTGFEPVTSTMSM